MRKVLLSLIPLLALACGQEPVAPVAAGPSANWMNNPDNGNVKILRYGWDWTISFTDPDNGLRATHTTVPLAPGQACGPTGPVAMVEAQDVVHGPLDLTSRWIEVGQAADIWIVVRDLNQPGNCYGRLLLAEGPGRMIYNDNDWYAFLATRANVNTYGQRGHGNLVAPDGRAMRYSGHSRCQWQPDGVGGAGGCVTEVNLH